MTGPEGQGCHVQSKGGVQCVVDMGVFKFVLIQVWKQLGVGYVSVLGKYTIFLINYPHKIMVGEIICW